MTANIATVVNDNDLNLASSHSKTSANSGSIRRTVQFVDDTNICSYLEDPEGNSLKQEWWSEEELNESLDKDIQKSRKEELQQRRKNRRNSYDKRGLNQYLDQASRHAASAKYVKAIVQKSRKLKISGQGNRDSTSTVRTDSSRSVNSKEQEQPQQQQQNQKQRRNTFSGKVKEEQPQQLEEQAASPPTKAAKSSRGRRLTLTGVIRKSIHSIKIVGLHHHRGSGAEENPHEALQKYCSDKSQPAAVKAVQIAKHHEAEAMHIFKELLEDIKEGREQYPGAAASRTSAATAAARTSSAAARASIASAAATATTTASAAVGDDVDASSTNNELDESMDEEDLQQKRQSIIAEADMRQSIDAQVRQSINRLKESITNIDVSNLPPMPEPKEGFFRQISI